jgi:hypothetical protein
MIRVSSASLGAAGVTTGLANRLDQFLSRLGP